MSSFLFSLLWFSISLCNAWLIMRAMGFLIKIKENRAIRFLLLVSCWILSTMVIFIGDPFNILASTLFFLIVILFTCEGSRFKKITVATMFVNTLLSFNALRDNYLEPLLYMLAQKINALLTEETNSELLFVPSFIMLTQIPLELYRLLFVLASFPFSAFLYLGIRKFAPNKDYALSDSLWKLLFLLTVTPFGIVLASVTLFDRKFTNGFLLFDPPVEYLVLLSIATLSLISLLWCIIVLARQQKLEQQNMFMEINRKYYELMEQQHFEIRRLKHDLANHLQVLSALPEEQRDAYLKNLTENAAVTQSLSYCKDATVNAVLSVKKNLMDRYDIRMEFAVDISTPLPFDKTDVCALYANALDNAAEACMKLPQDKRIIILKSKAQKGLFCLEVSNPVSSLSKKAGDTSTKTNTPPDQTRAGSLKHTQLMPASIPPTSKSDKGNHGFGLRGIKEIVERYHGSLELKTVNGMFNLFLYIPLR